MIKVFDASDDTPPGDVEIEYNGVLMKVRDCPDRWLRIGMGFGHDNPYGRPVVPGDWPYTPNTCERAIESTGEWIEGGTILVCPGCGLDCT